MKNKKYIFHANINQKKVVVPKLILSKVDFRAENITRIKKFIS